MDIEFQSVEEIRLLQERLLSQQIAYVSQHWNSSLTECYKSITAFRCVSFCYILQVRILLLFLLYQFASKCQVFIGFIYFIATFDTFLFCFYVNSKQDNGRFLCFSHDI